MEIAYGMSLDVLCSSDNEQGDKANRVYASSRPISLQSVILMVKKKRKRKKKNNVRERIRLCSGKKVISKYSSVSTRLGHSPTLTMLSTFFAIAILDIIGRGFVLISPGSLEFP